MSFDGYSYGSNDAILQVIACQHVIGSRTEVRISAFSWKV